MDEKIESKIIPQRVGLVPMTDMAFGLGYNFIQGLIECQCSDPEDGGHCHEKFYPGKMRGLGGSYRAQDSQCKSCGLIFNNKPTIDYYLDETFPGAGNQIREGCRNRCLDCCAKCIGQAIIDGRDLGVCCPEHNNLTCQHGPNLISICQCGAPISMQEMINCITHFPGSTGLICYQCLSS